MQVSIKSIIVTDRVRRDLGDLAPLMDSLQRHGQMNPVILTRDLAIVAGHRRLESARRLGWHTVEAVIMDSLTEVAALEMELDENVHRKPLTEDELREGCAKLEKLKNPGVFTRIARFFNRWWARLFGRARRRSRP